MWFPRFHCASMMVLFVDPMLNMISGFVFCQTWYMIRFKYHVGRERLEPMGMIGMSYFMVAAILVTLEQALFSLLELLSNSSVNISHRDNIYRPAFYTSPRCHTAYLCRCSHSPHTPTRFVLLLPNSPTRICPIIGRRSFQLLSFKSRNASTIFLAR